MNKKRIIAAIAALVLILVFIVPMGADMLNIPVSKDGGDVLITIEDGTSTFGIARLLKKNELIRSSTVFLFKVKTGKYNGMLRGGTYTLSKNMSIEEMCALMSVKEPVRETVTLTFPEGYTLEQMAQMLEENSLISKDSFISALSDNYEYEFLNKIPKDGEYTHALQGFLFPDTYEFYKDSSAHEIVDRMLSRFNEVYFSMATSSEDIFEIITKASMIEKEAKLESERPVIAGVIENRTAKGMAFQIDATVLYAATDGLYNNDNSSFIADNIKNLNSPYNTYMYPGLPAGPICNPGTTSIKAALNPDNHTYLYYHTDTKKNDGSHIFTQTYGEHTSTMN